MSTAPAKTYWNGEPAEARRVVVIVADAPEFPNYWARRFVGTERNAVEVTYNGKTFYLDDEGYESTNEEMAAFKERFPELPPTYYEKQNGYPGWGWAKVTVGRGGPRSGHASLEVERVVKEREEVERAPGDRGRGARP